jgi:hypothetical protein
MIHFLTETNESFQKNVLQCAGFNRHHARIALVLAQFGGENGSDAQME